jgi:hypothetical protein
VEHRVHRHAVRSVSGKGLSYWFAAYQITQ